MHTLAPFDVCPRCSHTQRETASALQQVTAKGPQSFSSRLMSCSMTIEQKLCKVKIFQLFQSMSNAMACINKRFAVKNSGRSYLALIRNLSDPRTTILHAKNWFNVARCEEKYTVFFNRLIQTYGLVFKASCYVWDDMCSFPNGC